MISENKRPGNPSGSQSDDGLGIIIAFKWYVNKFENLLYQAFAAHEDMPGHIPEDVWRILLTCEVEILSLIGLRNMSDNEAPKIRLFDSQVTTKRIQGHISIIQGLLDILYAKHPNVNDLPNGIWTILHTCETKLSPPEGPAAQGCDEVRCMPPWQCLA